MKRYELSPVVHKTPPFRMAFCVSRAGHWPPSKSWPVDFSTVPIAGFPAGRPLFSGPPPRLMLLGRMLLPTPAFLWARRNLPAAGTSLATHFIAIAGPLLSSIGFRYLRRYRGVLFLDSSSYLTEFCEKP